MSQSYGNSLRWECCRCYHTNRSSVDILCSSRSCRHVKCTLCQSMTLSSLPSSIVPSNVVPSSSLLSSSSSVPSSSLSLPLSLSSRVVASWNCHHCSFANTRYSYMCEICLRDRDRTNRAPIVTNATSSPSFSLSSSSSVASLQPSYQLSSQLLLDTNDSKRSSPAVSQMVTGESKHMGANDGHNSNGIKGDIHHDNRASNSNGDINHNHGDDGHAPLSRQAQWVYDNSYNHGALLSHSRPSLSSLSSSSQRWQRFDEEYQDKIELAFMQKQVKPITRNNHHMG